MSYRKARLLMVVFAMLFIALGFLIMTLQGPERSLLTPSHSDEEVNHHALEAFKTRDQILNEKENENGSPEKIQIISNPENQELDEEVILTDENYIVYPFKTKSGQTYDLYSFCKAGKEPVKVEDEFFKIRGEFSFHSVFERHHLRNSKGQEMKVEKATGYEGVDDFRFYVKDSKGRERIKRKPADLSAGDMFHEWVTLNAVVGSLEQIEGENILNGATARAEIENGHLKEFKIKSPGLEVHCVQANCQCL